MNKVSCFLSLSLSPVLLQVAVATICLHTNLIKIHSSHPPPLCGPDFLHYPANTQNERTSRGLAAPHLFLFYFFFNVVLFSSVLLLEITIRPFNGKINQDISTISRNSIRTITTWRRATTTQSNCGHLPLWSSSTNHRPLNRSDW